MKNYKYIALLLLSLGIISCENNDFDPIEEAIVTEVQLNTNGVDFSKYVALGASFTAGFTDGALFKAGQENSFPNILASKFGTTNFMQPLMNDNFGGLILGGNPVVNPVTNQRLFTERFVFGGSGPVPLKSVISSAMSTTDFALNNPTGPFSNLGVPGAKSFHMIAPGYGNIANFPAAANPYAIRITGATPNKSMLELAVEQQPTFFTLSEVGGNDILGYATSGGDGTNPITPTATFDFALTTLVNGLTANGAKGAIGNLPNITSLAFFTTVAYNAVPLDEATAAQLNAGYAAYNGGLKQAQAALAGTGLLSQEEVDKRTIVFAAGQNAVVIIDEDLTDLGAINPAFASIPKFRQATADDLILLTAASLLPTGVGTATPLSDTYVLTPQEQNALAVATAAYNESIATIAAAKGLALVDLNSVLVEASTNGIPFDNYVLRTNLVTGGLVSLDGVHLTSRGYALMANSFLKAIDATYGTNFGEATNGLAKADDYPTNYSPILQ